MVLSNHPHGDMETVSALLALCEGNPLFRKGRKRRLSMVNSLNKRLNKLSTCRSFEMPWRSYEVFVMKKLELIMRHRCGSGQRSRVKNNPWWRHQMKTFFALLALCAGNSPVTGEFSAQTPVVTRSFDVFFDLCLNKRLSKNGDAGDLRHNRAHYDVNVMICRSLTGTAPVTHEAVALAIIYVVGDLFPAYLFSGRQFHAIVIFSSEIDFGSRLWIPPQVAWRIRVRSRVGCDLARNDAHVTSL